ncbi:hypothetical protein EV673_1692 [Limnobacter thiooxidans]|uniref:Glycine zipper family protein n=1 Tax=Limnobacter thiooxidans TaxID=131080 RepID=A0AA86J110_9BURK|nr:hypothetical protein EV673_1692 [Limnobacter thiooxidans]BET27634.1 hypothetical protein RGQ30_31350 [Limnobacter thiooxidans]
MFNSSFGKLSLTKPAFYIPQPQHSLVDVIAHSYGIVPGQEPIFSTLLDYLLALNPTVKNPRMALGSQAPRTLDFISHDPDTILCMNPTVVKARIRQVVNGGGEFALVDTARSFVPADPAERGVYEFLARLSNDTQHVTDFAGTGLGVLGYLSGVQNRAVIGQLQQLNTERLAGKLSVRQYQLRQQDVLNNHLKKLGWMGRHMHGGQNAFNVLYQNRAVGVNPSPVFVKHAERMAKLSSFAKRGSVLLTGFGVAGTCGKIGSTQDIKKKNEVLWVDGIGLAGGLGGGLAGSIAVGLVLASGPVGWGVALVASAAGGYFAQEAGKVLGKKIYDQYGNSVDLVSASGIGQLCS